MRSTRHAVAYAAPDRGRCPVCSRIVRTRLRDGLIRLHDGCPGGGRPPVRVRPTEDVPLPD